MDKKKILLVSQGFYPENTPRAFRATELAKELARQGHDVVVLTNPKEFDIATFALENNFKINYTRKVKLNEIKWHSSNKFIYVLNRIIVRLLQLLLEYPGIKLTWAFAKSLKKLRNKKSKYDLLISFAVPYPVHWGVAWVWNRKKPIAVKWIADCGDPYYLDKLDSFRKPFYFAWIEKWFFRKVDKIAISREEFKVNYFPEFHSKIIEIPQGFNIDEFKYLPSLYQKNLVPTFAFAGMLAPRYRNPEPLMDMLQTIETDFKFYIFTASIKLIEKYKIIFQNKLQIMPVIPRNELLPKLATMDFLVNIGFNPNNQSPSKLIDYALTGRPILNLNGSLRDKEILLEFLRGDYSNQFQMDITKHDIKNIAKKFLEI